MEETLRIIADYVRRCSPQAAETGADVPSLAVHRIFDSIAMVDFIAFLERSFQIRISDADVLPQNFETFRSVARLVDSKRTQS